MMKRMQTIEDLKTERKEIQKAIEKEMKGIRDNEELISTRSEQLAKSIEKRGSLEI